MGNSAVGELPGCFISAWGAHVLSSKPYMLRPLRSNHAEGWNSQRQWSSARCLARPGSAAPYTEPGAAYVLQY